MLIDESDALLAGLRCNHHDDTDVILVGNRLHHFQIVIERKVWNDGATHTALHTTLEESLDAIVHDRVEITHQNQWQLHFILDGLELTEERLHGHSVLQGFGTRTLDDWSVSQRVTERNAHLNHIDAMAFHGFDDSTCALEGWTTGTEIQAQKLAVFIVCK